MYPLCIHLYSTKEFWVNPVHKYIESPVVWTCKCFHVGAAIGMLVALLLLLLSLAMDNGKFDHGGGGGGGGGPAATAAAVVAVMDDDWRQKRLATRALTVA
jgi:hypothetical protein